MSIPMLKLVCNECGREFEVNPGHFAQLGFKNLPKRCPTCNDIRQGRPSVVVERKLQAVYDGVEIVSLPPGEWEQVAGFDGDQSGYRLTVKGRRFGASWYGRIDLFSQSIPKVGDVVSVRTMEAEHKVKQVLKTRPTMRYGEVTIEEILPVTDSNPEAEVVIKTHRYLVIEPWEGESTCRLVWVEAHTKTTLKGLGRQYWAEISGAPIASWRISGGVRSGRAHTDAVLAIVDKEHPLYVTVEGDIQEEKVYD